MSIGDWRTIMWELGSLERDNLPYYANLSFCLDGWQIKGLEPIVMPRWANDVLSLLCVRVRGTPLGVITPVKAKILVIGSSDREGGFMGRFGWLLLVLQGAWLWCHQIGARGAAVVCPCAVGIGHKIGYKSCALGGSSSFHVAPVTG